MPSSRRRFLQTTAVATSALAYQSPLLAADDDPKLRLAAIGVGGSRGAFNQGGNIARQAARYANLVAVCDVDKVHCAEFNKSFDGKLNEYTDYRQLLEQEQPQVVTIGTPDHWHVPIAIAALRAGADVYCEKPLTLTIDEGKQIRRVVEETGRVFQVGTQQRSDKRHFLNAIAIVQSGRLGKNVNAYLAIGGAPAGGPFETTAVPDGLDWDMWVGPAPKAEYSDQRRKEFRWFFDYSGGKMTDWGAHHIDIAQWALAPGETGPVKIKAEGKFPELVPADFRWQAYLNGEANLPNGFNTATEFHIDLTYENGAVISVNHLYKREGDNVDFDNGIMFEGELGRIFVNRGKLEGTPVNQLTEDDRAELDAAAIQLCKGKRYGNHMRNFFECIADRSQPISDVWSHHRTMTSCHLCNIALMLGRELSWDPQAERFVDDEQADALMSRRSREVSVPNA
jgi:predicted dehydrogenase